MCVISCSIFEEHYLSSYTLTPDQISLSDCLYFVRYWAKCVFIKLQKEQEQHVIKPLVICATQLVGNLLLKMLKYFKVMEIIES